MTTQIHLNRKKTKLFFLGFVYTFIEFLGHCNWLHPAFFLFFFYLSRGNNKGLFSLFSIQNFFVSFQNSLVSAEPIMSKDSDVLVTKQLKLVNFFSSRACVFVVLKGVSFITMRLWFS